MLVTRFSDVAHNGDGTKLMYRSLVALYLKDMVTDAYGGYMVMAFDMSFNLKKIVYVNQNHDSYPPHPDCIRFLNHYDKNLEQYTSMIYANHFTM